MAVQDNLIAELKVHLPGAVDAGIKLGIFDVVDELAREALRAAPPADPNADPSTWLSSADYQTHYQTILHGVLARSFAQPAMPWTSPELANAHMALYRLFLEKSRAEAAGASATIQARLINALRVQLPGARDAAIELELFNTIDELAREALRITAPDTSDPVALWLPVDQWVPNYQTILDGTLWRMFAQVGKEWTSAELAAAYAASYRAQLDKSRAEAAGASATIQARLINALRVQLPGARDAAIELELFNTIDELAREALRITAPVTSDPVALWLPVDQWVPNYQTILDGTLWRMFAQVGKEWTSPELAAAYAASYRAQLGKSRAEAAGTSATLYARVINAVRAQIPDVRDTAIELELFNVANKVRVEALNIDRLADTDTNPAAWVPTDKWELCYLVLLEGTLARLLTQSTKPWFSAEAAAAHSAAFARELDVVREATSTPLPQQTLNRIISDARVRLPGALNETVQFEMFSVVDEFLRAANLWRVEVTLAVTPSALDYTITPAAGSVFVRLVSVVDNNGCGVSAAMPEPGSITLQYAPAQAANYKVTLVVSVDEPSAPDVLPVFPPWIAKQYREGLLDGVLGRMMSQPAKPYSSQQLAVYHMRRFRNAMAAAKSEAMHQNLYAGQSWRFPQSFSTRRH